MDFADATSISCTVVTNAPRANAELVLEALGLRERFRTVVIGEEQAHAKPHPEPYLVGLAALGAKADRSLAFEDSRSGTQAAVAAGIATVGLMSSLDATTILMLGAQPSVRDLDDARLHTMVRDRLLTLIPS